MKQKSIEEQFDDFLKSSNTRAWLTGIEIAIYVRKESKTGKSCLTIANVEYTKRLFEDPEISPVFLKYIKLFYRLNPFDFTCIETAGKELAQWLWDNDWVRIDQPMCFVKARNHGEVPWNNWY